MEYKMNRIDLLTQEQIDWCDEYCNFNWFVKDDGKVYSINKNIEFKNKKKIYSFLVTFADCEYFNCNDCVSLKSLKGVSEKINGNFYCSRCDSLESLEGAPIKVDGNFGCYSCKSLKSFRVTFERVGGYFDCSYCDSLISLKGAPKSTGGDFGCSNCSSLKSLEGMSKNVGGDFFCHSCKSLKFIDELKNIKIGKKIFCNDCPKLKKYDSILKDMKVFRKWQKSEYTADEFLKEYSGFIEAQKYGI